MNRYWSILIICSTIISNTVALGKPNPVNKRNILVDHGFQWGDEILVNDDTTWSSGQDMSSITFDKSGNFVVVWEDGRHAFVDIEDYDTYATIRDCDIYAQRFDSSGAVIGKSFRVNDDYTIFSQISPSVAIGGDNIIVVWQDGRDEDSDVYAQIYDLHGNPIGSNFRINENPVSTQEHPAVSADSAGNFVIVYQWFENAANTWEVYARRFDAAGNPIGNSFIVNDNSNDWQRYPEITMNNTGNFIVTWTDERNSPAWDIYAQRYDSFGIPQGSNFRVNTTGGFNNFASVCTCDSGDFVITWMSSGSGAYEIYARRYDANGNPQGGTFKVNDVVSDSRFPSAGMDADGNFSISFRDKRNGDMGDIYAQRYDINGNPQGSNFRCNDDIVGYYQEGPALAEHSSGKFVTVWRDIRADWRIYGQRFDASGNPQGSNFGVDYAKGGTPQQFPAIAMNDAGNTVVTWMDMRVSESTGGFGFLPRKVYVQRFDSLGNHLGENFRVTERSINFDEDYPSVAIGPQGNFVIAWNDEYHSGNICARVYNASGAPVDTPFIVTDLIGQHQRSPCVAMSNSSNFTVTWCDYRGGTWAIWGRRFDPLGNPLGPCFQVSSPHISTDYPSIRMNSTGNFIVVWQANEDIYARRYDSLGNPQGSSFKVDNGTGSQDYPSVFMNESGAFLVTWQDRRNGVWDIYAQGYDANGNPQGSNFKVNDNLAGAENWYPCVALTRGDTAVVSWMSFYNDGDPEVMAQFYVGNNPVGENIMVNEPDSFPYCHQFTWRFGLTSNNSGKLAFAWSDIRRHKGPDIYMKLANWGVIGVNENAERKISSAVKLGQNMPNPFYRNTLIEYQIVTKINVCLKIYDVEGRIIITLVDNKPSEPGQYSVNWRGVDNAGREIPAGVYFCHLETDGLSQTRKLVLLR